MTTLLLRLSGPLQSWGDSSRFARRGTRHEPTKSGVLGLLAAAQGRRRTDPIEDLVGLAFGVRVDQPGRLVRDFQTARSLDGRRTMPLSYRYYLADATFVAGVEGERSLIEGLDDALRAPEFPLYLGRRSCVPAGPVSLGVRDGAVVDSLTAEPWQAPRWYRRRQPREVHLPVIADATESDLDVVQVRDRPVSFSPERRQYGWRGVVWRDPVRLENPDGHQRQDPDFLAPLGGS